MRNWREIVGEPETREKIIARWRRILTDPTSLRIAKRMATEALRNLGDEGYLRREPGQDDEERTA